LVAICLNQGKVAAVASSPFTTVCHRYLTRISQRRSLVRALAGGQT
jgi:hypothetical protein